MSIKKQVGQQRIKFGNYILVGHTKFRKNEEYDDDGVWVLPGCRLATTDELVAMAVKAGVKLEVLK